MSKKESKTLDEQTNSVFKKDVKMLEEIQKRYLSLMDIGVGISEKRRNIDGVLEQALSRLNKGLISNYNNYMATIKGIQSIWDGSPTDLREYINE